MEGVTILNEFIYEGAILQPWLVIGLSCSIGGIIWLLFSPLIDDILGKWYKYITVIAVLICLFGVCTVVWAPREQIPRYQVIISDEVNFNNFNDCYKIIKQEGLIYTVEKRES